jgi:hypothetical protein
MFTKIFKTTIDRLLTSFLALSSTVVIIYTALFNTTSRDSSADIGTAFGLHGRGSILGRIKRLLHSVQTGSETHSASYPMVTEGFFPRE